jgi:aminopeptidase N
MVTEYEDTPSMSSYLVAIVISEYECKNGTARPSAGREVDIRVCARSNAQDKLGLALEASIKTSEFFEKYLNIEYPMTKLGILFFFLFNSI